MAWGNGVARPSIDFSAAEGHQLEIVNLSVIHSLFMPHLWIQISAAVSLFISMGSTVPLVFFVIATWFEDLVKKRWFPDMSKSRELWFRCINRAGLLLACCAFNLLGQNKLPDLQGFTGAITTTAICAIIPNTMFLFLIYRFPEGHPFRGASVVMLLLTCFAIFMGLACCIIGFMFNGLSLFGVHLQDTFFSGQ